MLQSSTRSWFLRDKMDFEILVQALFNERDQDCLKFGLNELKRCLNNISFFISFKAGFYLELLLCKI